MTRLRPYLIASIFLLAGFIYLQYARKKPLLWGYHEFFYTPKQYEEKLTKLENLRANLDPKRPNLNRIFVNHFSNLMPFWYGTRYSFNGQTHTPGEGSIACGYFVTTVLEDLGLDINRNHLAQLPSEEMIKDLVDKTSIQRFSGYKLIDFLENVKRSDRGLYVVGLDSHTGFILYEGNEIRFIHASGRFPFAVVNERAKESTVLRESKYRIVGKLSDDEKVLANWLR
jgi:hypothetical protein